MKYKVVGDKELLYMIESCENYGAFEKFLKNSDDFDFNMDLMNIGVETAVSNKIDIPRKYFGVFDKLISFIFKYKLKKVNIVEKKDTEQEITKETKLKTVPKIDTISNSNLVVGKDSNKLKIVEKEDDEIWDEFFIFNQSFFDRKSLVEDLKKVFQNNKNDFRQKSKIKLKTNVGISSKFPILRVSNLIEDAKKKTIARYKEELMIRKEQPKLNSLETSKLILEDKKDNFMGSKYLKRNQEEENVPKIVTLTLHPIIVAEQLENDINYQKNKQDLKFKFKEKNPQKIILEDDKQNDLPIVNSWEDFTLFENKKDTKIVEPKENENSSETKKVKPTISVISLKPITAFEYEQTNEFGELVSQNSLKRNKKKRVQKPKIKSNNVRKQKFINETRKQDEVIKKQERKKSGFIGIPKSVRRKVPTRNTEYKTIFFQPIINF